MTRNNSSSVLSYIILYLLLAVTSFEYFFRYTPLVYITYILCFLLVIVKQSLKGVDTQDGVLFSIFYSLTFIIILINGGDATSAIGRLLEIIGTFFISVILLKDFTKHFVNVMCFISIIALIFYGFYFIPPVKDYIFSNLVPHFPSLNMGNFTNQLSDTGGGLNIMIHNYHNGGASLRTGNIYRNCGPFWEPGQFAVFLNIALFFNIFGEGQKRKAIKNFFLVAALISTFSTGGFSAFLFLLFLSSLRKSTKLVGKILAFLVFVAFVSFFLGSDYMGLKIAEEMSGTAEDDSRFSAFLIQSRVIVDYPLWGGGDWQDYSLAGNSANGILLPFVYWGIPFGLAYYIFVLLSFKKFSRQNGQGKSWAYSFFALVLILAFSQTITVTRWFLVLIMVGFLRTSQQGNNYKYTQQ